MAFCVYIIRKNALLSDVLYELQMLETITKIRTLLVATWESPFENIDAGFVFG